MTKMRKGVLLLLAVVCSVGAMAQGMKSFSVLGDSYSTFRDYVEPDTNICWYAYPERHKTDVKDVTQTWWYLYAKKTGMKLCVNNSFSGSTICNTGYEGKDYYDRSFVTRMKNLGNPDQILIFGGTNDAWAKSPIGWDVFTEQTERLLYNLRPAMARMLGYLQNRHPNVEIVFILNCDLEEEYNEAMRSVCKHFGVKVVELKGIDKISGHPSVKGMEQICEQLTEALK